MDIYVYIFARGASTKIGTGGMLLCRYVCTFKCVCACVCACVYVCMNVCIYTCTCTCIYVYIHFYQLSPTKTGNGSSVLLAAVQVRAHLGIHMYIGYVTYPIFVLCYIPYVCMPVDRYTYIVHTYIDFFASRYTHEYRVCHIPYICMHVGIHTYIVQIYIDLYVSRYTYIYTVCHVPYLTVAVKFHCHSEKICDSQIITCSSNRHSAKDGARNSTYNHAVQHRK